MQTIDVTAGAVEYTWPIVVRELNGADISAVTIEVSFGSSAAPDTWQTPDVDDPQADAATRVVQILIGDTLAPDAGDDYYLWVRITDAPEVVPRRVARLAIV